VIEIIAFNTVCYYINHLLKGTIMNLLQLKTAIDASIEALAAAEKITKKELGSLSRTILEYIIVGESTDIATVNRLLGVLTPMNKQAAELYFEHFLPYVQDDKGLFGAAIKKQAKKDAKIAEALAWLEDENNNIWAWAADNIEVKAKDYAGDITKAIKSALAGNDLNEALTVRQVLGTVIATDGVELADLVGFLGDLAAEDQAEQDAEQVAVAS
jgi:hypothetical protein